MATPLSRATKRARSTESLGLPDIPRTPTRGETPDPPEDSNEVPAFLRQSKLEINNKFKEINWQENIRIVKGKSDPESEWVQDSSPEVFLRNRYLGVQPWDNHRVRLKVGEGMLDYINASPISLKDPILGSETRYIATQGPKRSNLSHFWQMVWQETGDTAVIVMLTLTEEAGKEKCFQYFPLDAETSPYLVKSSGRTDYPSDGQVEFVELEQGYGAHTHVRKLHLTFGEETKLVWHILFTAIADFGVPQADDREELLDLVKLSAAKNINPENPRIVHCSAGVGRSGTFIALEHLIAQADSGALARAKHGDDPIFSVVQQLREQRMMMVQSDVQYQFLYDILAEQLQRKRAENQIADQPSPKLRRLSGGIKSAMLDEEDTPNRNSTPDIRVDFAESEATTDGDRRAGDTATMPMQPAEGPNEVMETSQEPDGEAKANIADDLRKRSEQTETKREL